jgi:hypothetical protein
MRSLIFEGQLVYPYFDLFFLVEADHLLSNFKTAILDKQLFHGFKNGQNLILIEPFVGNGQHQIGIDIELFKVVAEWV